METISPRKRLRDEVTCSICLEYFTDPVILDCDHSFCHTCIAGSWQQSSSYTLCPLCNQSTKSKKFKANRHLASIAEITKELNEGRKDSEGRLLCGKHEEPLKLFCKDDKALICVVCDKSREHRDHNVIPAEEAAQERKDQISKSLEILKRQKEEILEYKSATENESQDLLKEIETEKGNTKNMLKKLSQFIIKNFPRTLMDEIKKEIVKTRNEHLSRLTQELCSLDGIIQEMEEQNQRSVPDLLQDVEQTLQKGERGKFVNPVVFPLTLKWKIWQCRDKNSSLEKIIKQFKDAVNASQKVQEANVTLDIHTAHPQLVISKDKKSLTLADQPQLPLTPFLGFHDWPCAQGWKLFNLGTCYWEVDVRNEGGWAVGVLEEGVYLEKKLPPTPENGVWAIGRWKGQYRAVISPLYPPLTLSEEPKKIRLCLNNIARLVMFFDADTAALLYTFSMADLFSDAICPFFGIWEKTHLQICA